MTLLPWIVHLFVLLFCLRMDARGYLIHNSTSKVDHSGFKVYAVTPSTLPQLSYLISLLEAPDTNHQYDFWLKPTGLASDAEIMVSPLQQNTFETELRKRGIAFRTKVEDVQRLEDAEEASSNAHRKSSHFQYRYFGQGSDFALDQYHNVDEIYKFYRDLNRDYPSITKVLTIGTTTEGRPLIVFMIGKPDPTVDSKPAFFIDAGFHAREWIGPAITVYMINELVTKYATDDNIRDMVDKLDWYFVALANPDGYEYSKVKDRYWRKTRSRHNCKPGVSYCCVGVDPNRNFDFAYAGYGSSSSPCSEIYRGPSAFVEPETRDLANFILSKNDTIQGYITLHSYGQVWVLPYGYKSGVRPPDYNELLDVGKDAVEAIRKVAGTRYRVGNTIDLIYTVSGGSMDWVKGFAGIKYVYGVELTSGGFSISASRIIPTATEIFAGIKVVAKKIIDETEYTTISETPQ